MANSEQRGSNNRARGAHLVQATYEDATGRKWAVLVPYGREYEAHMGVHVGPPDLSSLGLPEDIAVRLHNQLFDRGLLTEKQLKGRAIEVTAALQAALRTDAAKIMSLYRK